MLDEKRGVERDLYIFHGEEVDNSKENADEVFRPIAALNISIIQIFSGGLEGVCAFCRKTVPSLITKCTCT